MPDILKGGITFTQASNVAPAGYGDIQGPLLAYIESYAENWEKNSLVSRLFATRKSTHFGENISGLTSMGNFVPTDELEPSAATDMREGFEKFIRHTTFTNSFGVSKEMIADNLILNLENAPKAFMNSRGRSRELFGASLYGAALKQSETATYENKVFDATTADGETLFSENHTSVYEDGPVQRNVFSDDLTVETFAEAETMMQNFTDDRGTELKLQPDTILIPNIAALKRKVWATVGSTNEPGTGDNDFNFLAGRYNVLVWNMLNRYVDPSASVFPWVLIDSQAIEDMLAAVFLERQPLDLFSDYVANKRKNVWYGDERYSAGFVNWRFAVAGGVEGASAL